MCVISCGNDNRYSRIVLKIKGGQEEGRVAKRKGDEKLKRILNREISMLNPFPLPVYEMKY